MDLSKEMLEVLLVGVESIELRGKKWVNRCIKDEHEHIEELLENDNRGKEDKYEIKCREAW